MLWDTHMHSHFSGDSNATPESMIEAARKIGLNGLCFTDHLDLDYLGGSELFIVDFEKYIPKMRELTARYEGVFPIHTGIELGLQPHLAPRLSQVLRAYDFDFVIGSTHMVHGLDPYYPGYFDNRTEEEGYREYFTATLENIAAFDGFDVYGHIDYVVRYGPNKNKFYSYEKFADVIDEILRTLIDKGKGIEINTSGFRARLGHPHPTETILKRYRELGGEIITVGADAHAPKHVAYAFPQVPEILRKAGFQYFTVFKNRKPFFLSLP